jgi:hypothetical protein
MAGLEGPDAREVGLDVGDGWARGAGQPTDRKAAAPWYPGTERERGRDEVGLHAVHVPEPVAERATEIAAPVLAAA